MDDGMTICADDEIWVCHGCGRTSTTQYGFIQKPGEKMVRTASPGWDESCMMNSGRYKKADLEFNPSGTVREIHADAKELSR